MADKKDKNKPATSRTSTTSKSKKPTTNKDAKGNTSRVSAKTTTQNTPKKQSKSPAQSTSQHADEKQWNTHVGEIWRGETKYIDKEPKKQRNYVVVIDNGKQQTVSKVKSIKVFDENEKNADSALVEINASRYGLTARSGVDFETFDTNRMSGKPLTVSDKEVFPEDEPRAKLGSHDKSRVLRHTGRISKQKKKR